MSSSYVRQKIVEFIQTKFPTEKIVDLSADYEELGDLLADEGVGLRQPWLGIQFVSNPEQGITVPAKNDTGKYRETGVILLHVVEASRLKVIDAILPRGEALQSGFRAQRIENVIVEAVSPLNTSAGATISFQKGYTSGTITVDYYCDKDL